jgi:hypothetical protein
MLPSAFALPSISLGRFSFSIIRMPASTSSTTPIARYGVLTREAAVDFCSVDRLVTAWSERNSTPPRYGASVVPTELNACARFSRAGEVADGPSCATNGLADTCSIVTPPASTQMAPRNNG